MYSFTAREMILFSKTKWPEAVRTNLWVYAQNHAINISNYLPTSLDGVSPLDFFQKQRFTQNSKRFTRSGTRYTLWTYDSKMINLFPNGMQDITQGSISELPRNTQDQCR